MKSPPPSRPEETTFAMEMLPLKTPIMAVVSRACDAIAITLPVMTPCITPNLVFRILSPWNGWVEGAGRGPGQGSAEAERGQTGGGLHSPNDFISLPSVPESC